MSIRKKTIAIKVTSSIGNPMTSNAELHTLYYYADWLSDSHNIVIIGSNYSELLASLLPLHRNIVVHPPVLSYKNWPLLFRKMFHVPVAIFETMYYCLFHKVDFLFSLGGVFYNGLSVAICSRIFGIKSCVRTAEDHRGVLLSQGRFTSARLFKWFEYELTRIAFKNSSIFLSVGQHSLATLKEQFSLADKECYSLPGPADYKLRSIYDQYLSRVGRIDKNSETPLRFLFVSNGSKYKGTDLFFDIVAYCLQESFDVVFTWITNCANPSPLDPHYELVDSNYLALMKPVSKEDLAKVFHAHDCLLFLTPLEVGYGQISLEALLCDIPVLFFNSSGDLLDLIGANKSFNSCEYKEIISGICRDRDLLKKYSVSMFPQEMNLESLRHNTVEFFSKIFR